MRVELQRKIRAATGKHLQMGMVWRTIVVSSPTLTGLAPWCRTEVPGPLEKRERRESAYPEPFAAYYHQSQFVR